MLIGESSCVTGTPSLTSCIDHTGAPCVMFGCQGNGRAYTIDGRKTNDIPNELSPSVIEINK